LAQIDWPTVLVSLGASLVVALITFTLGLKSGKNQADRVRLQELYKMLLVHFNDIKSRLNTYPRKWEHYEEKKVGWGGAYLPPVKKMLDDGDSIYISEKIFNEALKLERDSLNYGGGIESFYEEFLTRVAAADGLFSVKYNVEREAYHRKCLYVVSPTKSNYTTGRISRLFTFLDHDNAEHLEQLFKEGGSTSFQGDGGTIIWQLVITPDTYADAKTLADNLTNIAESCESYKELNATREDLALKIETLTKKLERKAKEPIPFWETFFGAFGDVFRP